MASISMTDSAAPRDFQISVSSDSGVYSRCMLCAAGRRSFHCADCVIAGDFVHSSAPYSERFADKKLKFLRIRENRNRVQQRCESLLSGKFKQDKMTIEVKLTKEKISMLKLAIEQTKQNVEEKRLLLESLEKFNEDLQSKLPRYDKRVKAMERHVASQQERVKEQARQYSEAFDELAALRRARLRQLTTYIFPVRLSYDAQESIDEKDEILQDMKIVEQSDKMKRVNLHIGAAWLPANGDYSLHSDWASTHRQGASGSFTLSDVSRFRVSAGLTLAAQLTSLAAATLAVRLPHHINFSEYSGNSLGPLTGRVRRLFACVVCVCLHARQPPPPAYTHTLTLLHALCTAAATDDPHLGRVETWMSGEMLSAAEAWCGAWPELATDCDPSDEEPEHLLWTNEYDNSEEVASPPPPASLVTSAAASIASMWRGWTK